MMPSSPYFEDLQPCPAFPGTWKKLLAVGWLSKQHAFTQGPVEEGILSRIGHWQPPAAPQFTQVCELCGKDTTPAVTRALFVAGADALYVAPGLLKHYVRKHGYQPPREFLEALEQQHSCGVYLLEPAADVEQTPTPLSWLEAVRARPGMYFADTGAAGLGHAVFELVGNSLDAFLAGAATRLTVDVNDGWVTVEDDGQGMKVELLEPAFTEPHHTATLDGHTPHVHVRSDAHSIGLAPVAAVSERLEVETRRDGVAWTAAFSRGRIVEPVQQQGPTDASGTRVRFLFDDEVFSDGARYDLAALETSLTTLAWLAPKLDLRLQGKSLQQRGGLPGWLRQLAPNVIPSTVLSAAETVGDVDVEVAFGWQPRSKASLVRAFANYAETNEEKSSNRRGLIAAVRTYVRAKRASTEKAALNGLVGVVHVGLQHPKFGGPTRARLENKEVEKAVQQVVLGAINSAPQWWNSLHEAMR